MFDPGGEVHDTLEAEPDGFHPWLPIGLAREEPSKACDEAQHLVEARGFVG